MTQTADRTIEIVVANELVPAGTILAASHLRWQPWPGSEAELEGVYLFRTKEGETATEQTEAAVKELVGAAVKRAIPKGEPITGDKLCKPEQSGFLACALKQGWRAVGVKINPTTSAAGFVLPGDHVDVIMTQKLRQRSSRQDAEQETTAISLTILCNIQVLAIDQNVDDIDKSAKVGKTATLEVLPKEVQILSLAARMGQLSLALRGVGGDARADGQEDTRDCYNEVVTDIQITPPPPPPPPSGPPSVMVAVRPLAAGRVLRDRDLRWKVLDENQSADGFFVLGRSTLAELRGALLSVAVDEGGPVPKAMVDLPPLRVLHAGRDLPKHQLLKASDLRWRKLPDGALAYGMFVEGRDEPATLRGALLTAALARGEPVPATAVELPPIRVLVGNRHLAVNQLLRDGDLRWAALSDGDPTADHFLEGRDDLTSLIGGLLLTAVGEGRPLRAKAIIKPPLRTLVGTRHLAGGTLLRDGDLRWRKMPNDRSVDGYIIEGRDDPAILRGALLTDALGQGDPVRIALVRRSPLRVLVGIRHLAGGTLLRGDDLRWQTMSGDLSADGYIIEGRDDPATLHGALLTEALSEREPIRTAIFVRPPLRVVVGNHDLVTGEILRVGDLRWRTMPDGRSADGYFVEGRDDLAALLGALLIADTVEGQPVAATAVVKPPLRALVGRRRLSAGDILRAHDTRWRRLPEGRSADGYFIQGRDTEDELRGALLTVAVAAGDPVPTAAVVLPPLRVLVAGRELAQRALVQASDLHWKVLEKDQSAAGYFVENRDRLSVLHGAVLTAAVADGDRLPTAAVVLRHQPSFLKLALSNGMSAITLDGRATADIAKFVAPGDRVGVVLAGQDGNQSNFSQPARVLMLDRERGSVTLEVLPDRMAAILDADNSGGITLVVMNGDLPPPPDPRVLVASRSLAPGELLDDGDLRWQPISDARSADGYFMEGRDQPASLRGALLTAAVGKGEPVPAAAALMPPLDVLAAVRDLPGRDFLADGDLDWLQLAPGESAARYFVKGRDDPAALRGAILTAAVDKGEPVPAATILIPPLDVLAATRDLPGQDFLADGDLDWQQLAPGYSAARYFVKGRDDPAALRGAMLIAPVTNGVPVPTAAVLIPPLDVLAAARDLPGQEFLRDGDLDWRQLAPGESATRYFVKGRDAPATLRGAILTAAVDKGEPVPAAAVLIPPLDVLAAARDLPGRDFLADGDLDWQQLAPGESPARYFVKGRDDPAALRGAILTAGFDKGEPVPAAAVLIPPLDVLAATRDLPGQEFLADGDLDWRRLAPGESAARYFVKGRDDPAALRGAILTAAMGKGNPVPAIAVAKPPLRVLVASRPLERRHLLRQTDLRWRLVDDLASVDGYLVEGRDNRAQLLGAVLIAAVAEGKPVPREMVIRPDAPEFVTAALTTDMRALTIGGDAVAGIIEIAMPGDLVDVVQIDQAAGVEAPVVRPVRVLAIDRENGRAMLEFAPEQAVTLSKKGTFLLALRSPIGALPPPPPDGVLVILADRTLEKGKLLRDSYLRWGRLEDSDKVGDYFIKGRDKQAALRGAMLRRRVVKGEPVLAAAIIRPGTPGFLAEALSPGMRAISIAVDAVSGVAGFVSSDDRVDVILTQEIRNIRGSGQDADRRTLSPRRFSETILTNIRVIAIEQKVDTSSGQPVASKTATLEVTELQAEEFALAATMGKLSLSLISLGGVSDPEHTRSFTKDLDVSMAACDFVGGCGPKPIRPAAKGPPPSGPKKNVPPPPASSAPESVKLCRGRDCVEQLIQR